MSKYFLQYKTFLKFMRFKKYLDQFYS